MLGGTFLQGLGLGAGLMYLFDPDRGKRRRALLRDQTIHTVNKAEHNLEAACRDIAHRANGVMCEMTSMFRPDEVSDRVLVERVRSKLGRYCSHPGAIQVAAHDGCVTLAGPILAHEADECLAALCRVRGVGDVEDRLDRHEHADGISALQGGRERPGAEFELMQANWSPAARLLAGAAGGALMLNCLTRRTPGAILMGTLGFGLFMRATTNLETRRLTGVGANRRGIDVQKTININAPVERVFEHVSDFQKFSRFLLNVKHARDVGDGRIQWTLHVPGDGDIQMEEETVQVVPNELITWRSTTNSPVGYAGVIRCEPAGDRGTRVDVKMTYSPPGGALGHLLASIFGADPESQLDEAMLRLKTYLETGHPPHDVKGVPATETGRTQPEPVPAPAATRTETSPAATQPHVAPREEVYQSGQGHA
jgi:uncharacterized membrane protein